MSEMPKDTTILTEHEAHDSASLDLACTAAFSLKQSKKVNVATRVSRVDDVAMMQPDEFSLAWPN